MLVCCQCSHSICCRVSLCDPCSEFTKEHKGQIICGLVGASMFSQDKVTCAVTGGTGAYTLPCIHTACPVPGWAAAQTAYLAVNAVCIVCKPFPNRLSCVLRLGRLGSLHESGCAAGPCLVPNNKSCSTLQFGIVAYVALPGLPCIHEAQAAAACMEKAGTLCRLLSSPA